MNPYRSRYKRSGSGEKPLKEAIEEFLQAYRLKDKLDQTKVINTWEKTVGAVVARHTEHIWIRNRVLFVKVDSAAVRNELLYARQKIIAALNREAGVNVVDDMVLS